MTYISMEGNRFLILTILAVFLTTEVHCECPEGWFPYEASCYLFYQQGKEWTAAEDFCRNLSSYLTNINDESENQFLKKQLNLHGNTADFWVGATDAISEGGWRWMPGFDPIGYNDWMPGQPNDDHDQDCMQCSNL
ncbi:C-type lectin domain family 17, member A-like [Saccostrea cucullata]|uniref:C-type lectin domain family 17, member A-like n=1 Tax=Saccostrea cuccullata TaxID=36930 RepID=UPI002ED22CE4